MKLTIEQINAARERIKNLWSAFQSAVDRRWTDEEISEQRARVRETAPAGVSPDTLAELDLGIQRNAQAKRRERSGATAYWVGLADREETPRLEATRDAYRVAPDAYEAWDLLNDYATGSRRLPPDIALAVAGLELQLESALPSMFPSRQREMYVAARTNPHETRNATVIRQIEHANRNGWRGATFDPVGQPHEASALRDLQRQIAEVQAGRVPAEVNAALEEVGKVRRELALAMRLHKVTYVRPEDVREQGA